MRIIARRTLKEFWESGYPDAEQPLKAWFAEASKADWKTTADIKAHYSHASIIDAERVVFNIGGNKYRLVVKVQFNRQIIWIKFIGTHIKYDDLDVANI